MAKTKRGGVLPHPRKNRKRWTKSRLVLNVGACILVFLLFLFCVYTYRINDLQAERDYYREKENHYIKEGKQLEQKKEKLKSREYIEELARRELGMIYPEEKVIILED